MNLNDKWYKPDETWFALGFKNRDDFVNQYVIQGRFHNKVHEDVIKAYKTVEYIMALSWFHYPMYDEALKKLLGIYEMAVKLRCQQLNIDSRYTNHKQKEVEHDLNGLINKIISSEGHKENKWWLHHARKLRNIFAHPKNHGYVGGFIQLPIKPLINVINELFLDKESIKQFTLEKQQLSLYTSYFENGLFVLEHNSLKYLVKKVDLLFVYRSLSLWSFTPILNNLYQSLSNHSYPHSLFIKLENVKIEDDVLSGIDIENGSSVKVYSTNHPQNLEAEAQYDHEWNLVSLDERSFYIDHLINENYKEVHRFKYNYCWVNS